MTSTPPPPGKPPAPPPVGTPPPARMFEPLVPPDPLRAPGLSGPGAAAVPPRPPVSRAIPPPAGPAPAPLLSASSIPAVAAAPPELYSPAAPPRSLGRRLLRVSVMLVFAVLIVATGTALGLARYGGAYNAHNFATRLELPDPTTVKGDPQARIDKIEARLAGLAPKDIYVVVDTHNNKLRVYKGPKLLREAVCSTGSGILLKDPRDGRQWFFDTPQGEFKILRKQKNPLWIKPDWAFIEEGYLPPKNARDRVDDFSLGDYGLYMKDGYIIHGTIFKTLLGKRVTHGCIRLGDEDLKWVFETVPTDARVYLY
ncbi:MAG: L,D-transpeptidase [Thermoanaerobaculia bacterium]